MWKRMAFLCVAALIAVAICKPAHSYPTVNVKTQCGAVGDGLTNDTPAFQQAASIIQAAGGGTLIIPKANYLVGDQAGAPGYYLKGEDVFSVSNVNYLLIEGNDATLVLNQQMRFGTYNPATSLPYYPSLPFYNLGYAATIGEMITVTDSQNITIRNLELDGKNSTARLGGQWGDTGIQLPATGISLFRNTGVQITNVNSHNHALDGIMIGAVSGLGAGSPPTLHTLTDCSFNYNTRQGLSWVGGIGLTATGCKFNRTGRALNWGAAFSSAPAAGLDIEAEDTIVRDGLFQNCEFINNVGSGMVASSGDGGYSTFKNCLFWGTTSYSAWSAKPGLKYEDCTFHGTAVHTFGSPDTAKATSFLHCTFEDTPWTNGQVYSSGYVFESDEGGDNVTFSNCDFNANASKTIWFGNGNGYFNGCNFRHRWNGLADHDFMALIRYARLSGCHFREGFPAGTTKQWYIATGATVLTGNATIVDGPRVKWQNWSWGSVGTIPAGTYYS